MRKRHDVSVRACKPQRQGVGKGETAFLSIRREARDALLAYSRLAPLHLVAEGIEFNEKQA